MLRCILCFIICFSSALATAGTIERQPGESADAFVRRIAPRGTGVAHKPIETSVWQYSAPVIVAFYEQQPAPDDNTASTKIDGFVFIPVVGAKYEKVEIDSFEPEGGNPHVETVFFASTDKTQDKKLIVIVSREQNHADVKGNLYDTFVYRSPGAPLPKKLTYLKAISEKLSGGCDCRRTDGPSTKAKFKTAADVKAELKKLQ